MDNLPVLYVPVKDHGEAEVGEGDLHDETAADPVHLLEVIVAVQQGQASGDKMELYEAALVMPNKTLQELRMLSPSLFIQGSQCKS